MIVVADDLKSREPEDKERILEHQPSIPTYAKDLFIFTEHEKYRKNLEKIRKIIQSSEFSDIITYYFYISIIKIQYPPSYCQNILYAL